MPNSGATGMSRRLSTLDASWLLIESKVSSMHGGPIFILKGELPFERLFRPYGGAATYCTAVSSASGIYSL
jgi:hypothetical protein